MRNSTLPESVINHLKPPIDLFNKSTIMNAIKLTLLLTLAFYDNLSFAQDEGKNDEMRFRKFRLDFAGSTMKFIGKRDRAIQLSRSGFGGHITPAWNIDNNNTVGLKMVWSYHEEDKNIDHFSLLANYMYTYYYGSTSYSRFITFFGGAGAGISTGPKYDGSIANNPNVTSFAFMPYLGIRYGAFCLDGNYHFVAGNKEGTYFGLSFGIIFNGGFRKGIN